MMKRIVLIGMIGAAGFGLIAQPVMQSKTHKLLPGKDNAMSYCAYSDPGIAGEKVTWDFRNLEFKKAFVGHISPTALSEGGDEFTSCNTQLTEFNSTFFFQVTEDKMEQYGYSSTDGKVLTRYDIPFVKMRYPFTYGDAYSGSFSGSTFASGVERGKVKGDYTVEADAWGQLILPGDISYENTLRVKTEKTYRSEFGDAEQRVEITTYRWYNSMHRYPLLVLTNYSVSSGEKSSEYLQAAYNNNAVSGVAPLDEESIVLYPNPATDLLNLEFKVIAAGTISMSILDHSGRVIREFEHQVDYAGIQHLNLNQHISGLVPSNYILSIRNGDMSVKRSFSIIE